MVRLIAIVRAFLSPFHCRPYSTCCAAAILLCALTAPAVAQNKFWITGAGGTFGAASNWSTTAGGAGGAAPPAAAENANFTLGTAYTVSFGAGVTNTNLVVSNGTVTFDLNSFTYTITGGAGTSIGTAASQTGRLTIIDGTLAVDTTGDDVDVGDAANSTGFLTISTGGRLGNAIQEPDLNVGASGTGTMTIDDNGQADVATFNVGQNEGSTGTVNVAGPNAILDATGASNVGLRGNGTLNIQAAGTVISTGATSVGTFLGANGVVNVSNALATWNQGGAFILGDAGDGTLNVQSTGIVSTTGAVTLGNAATGVGAAIVTGADSTWNMGSSLNLGASGFGNMAITSGGLVTTAGTTNIASAAGSDGTLLVTGAGSRWNSAAVTVGNSGAGTLVITSGGTANTTGNVTLANTAAATGKASVSGTGSIWNVTGAMAISNLGAGTLTVENGGNLMLTGALTLNDPAGAPNGTLNFRGGIISTANFTRAASSNFNWTDGTFIINGGALNNGGQNLIINGGDSDDLPALRLSSGAQSTVANLPNLTVGSTRQGAVIVSGGSSFQTTTASFGSQDGSNGALIVEGVNSIFSTTGDFNLGGSAASGGGIGTINLGIGGTVAAGGTMRLWNGATVSMNGGTLAMNSLTPNGGRVNFNSGTVQFSATSVASAAVLNTLLGPTRVLGAGRRIEHPGNTLTLQSDLTVSGGTLAGGTLLISPGVVTRVDTGGNLTYTGSITNPASARLFITDATVSANSVANGGELHLAGATATINTNGFSNTGLVRGTGRVNNVVTNSAVGQIRVAAGERLEFVGSAGSNINDGLIDVSGGTLEFSRAVANSTVSPSTGLIAARNATLRFNSGLFNSGSLTFTAGVSDVFGDVTNQNNLTTPGRVVVTGGAQANFFDDVVNNGVIQVSAAGSLQSTAVFLGSFSGNGTSGGGHVFLEGDTRPGFSPGTMAFGGDVSFGPLSNLEIELAGTTPGTQFDRVTVADTATLAGTLKVSLLDGFKPAGGNTFQILTATGGRVGTFDNEVLPQLSGGLGFEVVYTQQAVTLAVAGVLGDYNLNGIVDAADYVVWRNSLGSNNAVADGSGNGTVDQDDYNVWRANFGRVAAFGGGSSGLDGVNVAAAVPEPTSLALLICCTLGLPILRRRSGSNL